MAAAGSLLVAGRVLAGGPLAGSLRVVAGGLLIGGWPATVGAATSDSPGVQAPPQRSRIAMEVDTTAIHVGDPVSVRLVVDHPEGWEVRWPDSVDVAPFELLRIQMADPVGADAATRSTAELVVTSFELGELEIPPIELVAAGPDGAVETLVTDPFRIGVESVGLDESGDIREIKGPLSIARSWWGPVAWALLGLVLAAAVAYVWRRRRSRPVAAPSGPPPPPPRPHHLVALEALAALEASSLLERGQVKEYYVRVSEIVRSYVEGQLEVPALEMTTSEVADGLARAALGASVCEAFRGFLDRCDLVKFAKWRPSIDDARAMVEEARGLVRMTSGRAAEAAIEPTALSGGGADR